MARDFVEQFFDEFKECFRALVRETVAEELEPLRDVLLKPAGEPSPPPVIELVDVTEIARLLGEDVSTDKARRRAAQKVYDLAPQPHPERALEPAPRTLRPPGGQARPGRAPARPANS